MSELSLKEFNKLSEKEKNARYKDLNEHDKFMVRISIDSGIEVVGKANITEDSKKWAEEEFKKIPEERNKK